MTFIYNIADLHGGVGNYAVNLSDNLKIPLHNDFLSHKHLYIDFMKRQFFKKHLNDIVIHSDTFAIKYIGRKNYFVIHDLFFIDYRNFFPLIARMNFKYGLFYSKFIATKYIGISDYTISRMKYYGLTNAVRIYPFIKKFKKYDKKSDSLNILMDAANRPYKNLKKYQEFADYFYEKDKECSMHITKLGAPLKHKCVYNTGIIDHDQVEMHYSLSSVLLNFSENEGLGFPMVQAVLIEKPVVLMRNPVYEEILGKNYKYFFTKDTSMQEIMDMIYQAIDDKETIKNNYEIVSDKFDPQKLRESWEMLLQDDK